MKKLLSKYRWYHNDQFSCCGFLLDGDRHISGKEIENYFAPLTNLNQLKEKLKHLNGQFAIVCKIKGLKIAACDKLRTFPLFYHLSAKKLIVSDSAHSLLDEIKDPVINSAAAESLLLCGYTLNDSTLINDLSQIESGEIIAFDKDLKKVKYNTFIKGQDSAKYKDPANTLNTTIEDVFSSHLSALKDNMIAIPLSGGFDSRLISLMCKKYHPEKLLAFTYGRADSPEIELAKKVANKLDIRWIPVYYDENCIQDFSRSKTFESFYKFSSELSSMFFMQDYFAVKYLNDNNLIDKNTVFLPGHTGDVLSGGHISPGQNRLMSKRSISKLLYNKHFQYIRADRATRNEILVQIEKKVSDTSVPAYRIIENWEYMERQSKLIINSASVFAFFGYSWCIPLWDTRLIELFCKLDFENKIYSKLYKEVLMDKYFAEKDINFLNELSPKPGLIKQQVFKESVKRMLPRFIINSMVGDRDYLNYKAITGMLNKEIPAQHRIPPKQKNYYNAYLAQYLLYQTKRLILA